MTVATMPILFFVLSVAAVAVLDASGAPTPQAPVATPVPRSVQMAISRNEMIAADGGLQARAIEALKRMNSMARDHGVELTVQVPADAIDVAAEIERVAPFSVIKKVPARRPFKLLLRMEQQAERSVPRQGSSALAATSAAQNDRKIGSSPYVYIQMRNESQRETAREHALQLRQMGAYVSEVEIIVAEGPRRKQLRYFHAQDRKEAALLARSLSIGAEVQLLDLSSEYGSSVPTRHYELWLPPTIAAFR